MTITQLNCREIFNNFIYFRRGYLYEQVKKNKWRGIPLSNNFDGLVHCVGLTELFVRRYDESHVMPNITFHQKAKSLIVVGSHADRRRIQHAAREAGLQVVYVDPEGYRESDGFTDYPLESPQDNDFLFRCSASEFIERIRNILV